jgi:membrane protease YdiL (CAAX protease family)
MNRQLPPFVRTAWILIFLFVGCIATLQAIPEGVDDAGNEEDSAGLVMVQLQAEMIIGQGVMMDDMDNASAGAIMLDAGTVGQRQRYIAFMIGLGNLDAAITGALRMQAELASAGMEMTETQAKTQEMLDILSEGGVLSEDHPSLVNTLGWFGTFVQADETERREIESSAASKIMIVTIVVGIVGIAAVLGLIFLIIQLVKAFDGKLKSGLIQPLEHHGVYAEVFALWLLSFVVLTTLAGFLAKQVASGSASMSMFFVLIAFLSSLVVLFWARIRGISFKQIREDIGWTTGKGVTREICTGISGYAMTLPILGIGLLITLFLFFLQQLVTGGAESAPFQGTSGGSHPIIIDIANGVWSTKILVVFLAAVAAPVVEETMFRGVLYRQLRSSSCKFPKAISILCSVMLVSFLFAAIHPQGWIAIPALMGIAVGMNLMREWRGTLIPSMVVHGVSNGIVVSMMVLMFS